MPAPSAFAGLGSLASDESCVQAARHSGIVSAFDDGAAIREKRHFIWIAPELEHKGIMLDRAVGAQPG